MSEEKKVRLERKAEGFKEYMVPCDEKEKQRILGGQTSQCSSCNTELGDRFFCFSNPEGKDRHFCSSLCFEQWKEIREIAQAPVKEDIMTATPLLDLYRTLDKIPGKYFPPPTKIKWKNLSDEYHQIEVAVAGWEARRLMNKRKDMPRKMRLRYRVAYYETRLWFKWGRLWGRIHFALLRFTTWLFTGYRYNRK